MIEHSKKGKIDLRKFYIRRILRIWPLYYAVVFIGFVLFPIAKGMAEGSYEWEHNLLYYIFFVNNFDNSPHSAILGVLWSIAIEEQFYLVWPLFFRFLPITKVKYAMLTVVIISSIWRMTPFYGYQDTLSCISDMAIGGLGGYFIFLSSAFQERIRMIPKWLIILVYFAGLGLIFSYLLHGPSLRWLERNLFALFFLFVILEQIFAENSLFKIARLNFLTSVGKYTYGLYMLQFSAIYVTARLFQHFVKPRLFHTVFSETIVSLALSFLLAFISYHYFEKYFLNLKDKFSVVGKLKRDGSSGQ